MSILKRFIGADQVDESKILLSNNAFLRSRNAANNANINLLKVNAADVIEFASVPIYAGSPFVTEASVGLTAVPYTGASSNVDLNAKELNNVDKIGLNTQLLGPDGQTLDMIAASLPFQTLINTTNAATTGAFQYGYSAFPVVTFNGIKYAYVTTTGPNVVIQVFDMTNGTIVQEYVTSLPSSFLPGGVAVSVYSNVLYMDDADLHSKAAFSIDPSNGHILSQVSPTLAWDGSEGGMAATADGKVLIFTGVNGIESHLVALNGNLSRVSTQGGSSYGWCPTVSPSQTWLIASSQGGGGGYIMSLNPTTGVLGSPTSVPLSKIAISPDGKHIYDSNGTIYSLNESTGAVVNTGLTWPSVANGNTIPVAVSDDGTIVFSIDATGVVASYARNATTGALTLIDAALLTTGHASGGGGNHIIASVNSLVVPTGWAATSPPTALYTFAPAATAKIKVNSLQIADGSEGTPGYIWTSIDADGNGAWVAAPTPPSGANTTLSNLGTTALNADLLPSATNARNLGSASLAMAAVYTRILAADSGQNMDISANSINMTAAGGIYFNNQLDMNSNLITGLLDPDRPSAAATKNYVDNAIAGAGGANTTLSNLGTTSINANLIPSGNGSINLGQNFNKFGTLSVNVVNGSATGLNLSTGDSNNVFGDSITGLNSFGTGDIGMWTTLNASANANPTTGIVIATGSKTAGTGNSGDIRFGTGNSSGGNSGGILLQVGTAGGTRGKIQFKNGTEGTSGYAWMATDVNGSGAWQQLALNRISGTESDLTTTNLLLPQDNAQILGSSGQVIKMIPAALPFSSLSTTTTASSTYNHWEFRIATAVFSGKTFAYVTVTGSNVVIQVFNLTDNTLVQEYTTTLPNSFFPGGVAVSTFSNMIYLDDVDLHSKAAFTINPANGQITGTASPTMSWSGSEGGMTISTDGKVLVFSGNSGTQSFTIASNGNLTAANTQGGSSYSYGPVISPSGAWLLTGAYSYGSGQIMSLNPTTGILGSPTSVTGLTRFVISPDGKHIYDASGKIFSLNEGTGAVADTGFTWANAGILGRNSGTPVAVSNDGLTVFSITTAGVVSSYSRNSTTGQLTLINSSLLSTGNTSGFADNIIAGVNSLLVPSGYYNGTTPSKLYTFAAPQPSTIRLNALQIQDGTQGTAGQVWTSTGTDGSGAWAAAPVTGANTTLSNLGTTAINASLIPGSTGVPNLGSVSKYFGNAYIGKTLKIYDDPGYSFSMELLTGTDTAPSGTSVRHSIRTANGNTMAIYTANQAATVGDLRLETGNSSGGNSGNLILQTGTASGTRGKIQFKDGSEGTTGHVWTSTDTLGNGHWAAAGGGGASTSLNNLTSTSINANLLPDGNNTRTLGGSSNAWINSYITRIISQFSPDAMYTGLLTGIMANRTGLGIGTYPAPFGIAVNPLWVTSGDDSTNNAIATADINVRTGDKTAGTGNSGSLLLKVGTSSGGTRGKIKLQDGSEGAAGKVWVSTGTSGEGAWSAVPTNVGWTKYTFSYTAFSAASTTNDVAIAVIPVNSYVEEMIVKSTVQFSGGGSASFQVAPNWDSGVGSISGFGSDFGANAPAGSLYDDLVVGSSSGDGPFISKNLRLYVQCDVNLNTLTAGSVDVYVKLGSLS